MRRNLDFYRGQSKSFSGIARDQDGNPVDLSQATLIWRMADPDFLYPLTVLTVGDGISLVSGVTGGWRIDIKPNKTSHLPFSKYEHQGEAQIGDELYGFTSGRVLLRGNIWRDVHG